METSQTTLSKPSAEPESPFERRLRAAATFSKARDGLQISLVNAEGYAFFGANPAPPSYIGTGDRSTIASITSTTITFGSWSSDTVNLGATLADGGTVNGLGRYGLALESAHFYSIGGTTDDQDALDTVFLILY
jgi:hypothetical protein